MTNRYGVTLAAICCILLLCFLTACAPSPDNAQIEAAIRTSLSGEAAPPALDFEHMQVPMRSAGKANAVLWTADGELQRNYILEYIGKTHICVVTGVTTSRKNADGTYSFVTDDPGLALTELAPHFGFSDDPRQKYLLLYAGEGGDPAALRAAFEREMLPDMSAQQLADFALCDLGGDALILLAPKYEGLSVWINKIEHQGSMMLSGAEVARFENGMPVYIYCSFDDKLPDYEIHVSFDTLGEFFTTRETLLTSLKKAK